MDRRRTLFLALFSVGLGLRLWWLPLWGTFDTEVQKAWSARAATAGLADIYGPPDAEILRRSPVSVPRTTFQWGTAVYFVDYPPGSVLVLWVAGTLYRVLRPEMPNKPLFNAAVNLGPLAGSLAIAWMLRRSSVDAEEGRRRALAFWLNPAIMLAAPVLGYQDTVFGSLALGAVLALMAGGHAAAAALTVAAALVKPQGALLVPTLAAVVLREGRPAAWIRSALAGLATAAAVLAPWWSRGHLLSALDGCLRPLKQVTLAPQGLGLWWIAGYVMQWARTGPWSPARIETIDAFRDWAGWDPRLPARVLLAVATAAIVALLLRAPRDDRRLIPLTVVLQVHAYALLGTSVHENHTFLAVILAPLLLGTWPKARALLGSTSAFLFASIFLAAGFGRRITSQRFLEELRGIAGLDLSVVVAVAHVALMVVFFSWAARTAAGWESDRVVR